MLSKSRCDVVVHAEFRFSDSIPPPGPPLLLAHRTGIGASRSVDIFRGIAHVSL